MRFYYRVCGSGQYIGFYISVTFVARFYRCSGESRVSRKEGSGTRVGLASAVRLESQWGSKYGEIAGKTVKMTIRDIDPSKSLNIEIPQNDPKIKSPCDLGAFAKSVRNH